MPRIVVRTLLASVLSMTLALSLAACGGSDEGSSGTGAPSTAAVEDGAAGRRGGTLRILTEIDVSDLDPGRTYSSADLMVLAATQRPLYRYEPDDPSRMVPDLADGEPRVSPDGRTLTVRIRKGVRYSEPVNREVRAADVKYAIERGFNPNVANPYAGTYYGDVVGADSADGGPIAGITTPDDHTIVFRLARPTAAVLAQSLILPLSAPVPPEYARRFDARAPSDYGNHQVATGPYKLKADASGRVLGTGYVPGQRLEVERNPAWDPSTDDRPAYLDAVQWSIGNDPNVAGRQVLEGSGMTLGDTPTAALVKRAVQQSPDQIFFSPGAGSRYAALNTAIPPFDDPDVRKAVAAALDREEMRLVRGGEVLGEVANHFLYPGVPGFEEAGGLEGTGADFLARPEGDPELAARYLRDAGFASGRYEGDETIQVVGDSGDPSDKNAELFDATLRSLGFRTRLRLVDSNTMYGRFCTVPAARVHVCPNVGWQRDFADPQTVLDAAFNGAAIMPDGGNPNFPQLDDPAINRAMSEAQVIVDPQERAEAWAKIDRMITETGAAVPWLWDKQPVISSEDVRCAHQLWNQGHCDFAYSSLR
jgi:peptide/nickel transport system substrate-binding protein